MPEPGNLNDTRYGARMRGEGQFADQTAQWFRASTRRLGYTAPPPLSTAAFRRPAVGQLRLFDG